MLKNARIPMNLFTKTPLIFLLEWEINTTDINRFLEVINLNHFDAKTKLLKIIPNIDYIQAT